MKLYQIYLPKYFKDGTKIPEEMILKIADEIEKEFGGYSFDPFGRLPIIRGIWISENNKRYSEEMNVVQLFTEDTFDVKKWFKAKREIWRQDLKQESLFIIVQDAEIISD